MSKYDFGYEIAPKSTIEWAFEHIEHHSEVLELGPATGNLAYHLSTEKECIIDIVEIDEDAGAQAAKYARISCLGFEEGNLEKNHWFNKLQENQYDYIVVLDVLEHVRNPKEVLLYLASLLKNDGCLLLSIPNIAHNSVILDLLQGHFNYTNVGILDDTHVRFYTYESIKQLLNECGLVTIREQVKQEKVGHNEIAVDYGKISSSIEAYLKTKDKGTAYQYLFTIQKGTRQQEVQLEYDDTYDKLYEVVAFDADSNCVLAKNAINPKYAYEMEMDIPDETKRVRIDPLDANCVIADMRIYAKSELGQVIELEIKEFTGIHEGDKYVFFDDDPQMYIDIPEGTKSISFSWIYVSFDNEGLSNLVDFRDMYRQSQRDIVELTELVGKRDDTLAELWKRISELETQFWNCKEQLDVQNVQLKEEREQLRLRDEWLVQCKEDINALQSQVKEYQFCAIRQEEQLKMYSGQLEQRKEELTECRNIIDKQNVQLLSMTDALKISNQNLQESEYRSIKKDEVLEDFRYTLGEREKTIDSLNAELWDIQKTLWGRIYYKFKKDK